MGLFKPFSGKGPGKYERKGDAYCETGEYGLAVIEYETALRKAEKGSQEDMQLKQRVEQKKRQAKESLARRHKEIGEEIMASGEHEEAQDIFRLALELTEDSELRDELENKLAVFQGPSRDEGLSDSHASGFEGHGISEETAEEDGEYFRALVASLPKEMRLAYKGYGRSFREGYEALNQGHFALAAEKLSQAMTEHPEPDSFIPLELGTAHMNLGEYERARDLLLRFVDSHPECLQGYEVLCEILWELKAFEQAEKRLLSGPEDMVDSLAFKLLRGETLFQAQRYNEAASLYLECLKASGWDEDVARGLARAYEALGEKEKARKLYGEIMRGCSSCGARIDPFVKQRYAALCFESGRYSTNLLELYFSLAQEDPGHRTDYYEKISRIYDAQGYKEEAQRYALMAGARFDEIP